MVIIYNVSISTRDDECVLTAVMRRGRSRLHNTSLNGEWAFNSLLKSVLQIAISKMRNGQCTESHMKIFLKILECNG